MKKIIEALFQWSWLIIARVLGIITGLVVVPVAMPFFVPGVSGSDGRPILNLPRWAWLWGNDFDGLLGDKRKWWDVNCDALVFFGLLPLLRRLVPIPVLQAGNYLAMWWWAAIRNPANNMRFLDAFSAPIMDSKIGYFGRYTVEDKPGLDGWQFVWAEQEGRRWYGFYAVHCWSTNRALVIRFGFKIKPAHAGKQEPRKGLTFKANLYKSV